MDRKMLKTIIDVSAGRIPADLCIKNANVVDVFNKEVFKSDVYISQGIIAGFGNSSFPEARQTFDANGKYLVPGFIDSHLHIESSHLSVPEYARLTVPCGTTTVVADPHEIVNVCGIDGLDYMLSSSENLALSVFLQFPSCVPSTPFENSGAVLKASDIRSRIDNPRILGLGEMMDFVGLCAANDDVIDKIIVAKEAGKIVDGHYLGSPDLLDAYCCAGVSNDHECATAEGLRARIRRGMYVLLRQGTVCHDLLNLIKGVDSENAQYCLMCTDDCQAKTMIETGHIDSNVRMAIANGIPAITAICMATVNATKCFNLSDRGAVAPGRRADLLLLSSLDSDFKVEKVWCNGNLCAENRKYLCSVAHKDFSSVGSRMNVLDCSPERFALKLKSHNVRTIKINPGSVVTSCGSSSADTDENGLWKRNSSDVVKVAVVERHHGKGTVGLALLEGFGLNGGAVATSVAHDSHNVIVAGDNDDDMSIAVKELVSLGGGMTVVKNGKVVESVKHEIAGLMTDLNGEVVSEKLASIQNTARRVLGIHDNIDPFMTLCFMSLPVIPQLKVTDLGLFDVDKFEFVSVEE